MGTYCASEAGSTSLTLQALEQERRQAMERKAPDLLRCAVACVAVVAVHTAVQYLFLLSSFVSLR
jgi:hypothetical protein